VAHDVTLHVGPLQVALLVGQAVHVESDQPPYNAYQATPS
jgi:hypothetical protein